MTANHINEEAEELKQAKESCYFPQIHPFLTTHSSQPPSTSFACHPLNRTTYLLIEDDSFTEHPHIYIKLYPSLIFLSDTGCNSPRQAQKTITSLRQYLETYPVPANGHLPLNPKGEKPYLILCSHAHYDHILGIPTFLSAGGENVMILASANDKSFILKDLETHSLCKYLHIPTPQYTVSYWARHLEYLSYVPPNPQPGQATAAVPLRIQTLHIPGHTPDSLAWYDIDEKHLFVGDAFYARRREGSFSCRVPGRGLGDEEEGFSAAEDEEGEDAPIIFPSEGNWVHYMASLELLLSFIRYQNSVLERQWQREGVEGDPPRVKLGSGHITASTDAETMTSEVKELFEMIIAGRVPVKRSEWKRGEVFDYWVEGEEETRYSVLAPRRLVEEARGMLGRDRSM